MKHGPIEQFGIWSVYQPRNSEKFTADKQAFSLVIIPLFLVVETPGCIGISTLKQVASQLPADSLCFLPLVCSSSVIKMYLFSGDGRSCLSSDN